METAPHPGQVDPAKILVPITSEKSGEMKMRITPDVRFMFKLTFAFFSGCSARTLKDVKGLDKKVLLEFADRFPFLKVIYIEQRQLEMVGKLVDYCCRKVIEDDSVVSKKFSEQQMLYFRTAEKFIDECKKILNEQQHLSVAR